MSDKLFRQQGVQTHWILSTITTLGHDIEFASGINILQQNANRTMG